MSIIVPSQQDAFTLDSSCVTFCKSRLAPRQFKLFSARALRRLKYYYTHVYQPIFNQAYYTVNYGIDIGCPASDYTVTYNDAEDSHSVELTDDLSKLDFEDGSQLSKTIDNEMEKVTEYTKFSIHDYLAASEFGESSSHLSKIKTRGDGLTYADWEDDNWDMLDGLLEGGIPQELLEERYYDYKLPDGGYDPDAPQPGKRQYDAKLTEPPKKIFRVSRMGGSVEFDTLGEAQAFADKYHGSISTGFSTLLNGGVKRKGGRKRKGHRKPRKMPMIRNVQLGQINKLQGMDRPIITTLRYNAVLITDGAGTLAARFSLRNPLAAFNGSGAYVSANDYATLYDQYKIKSFCFQFQPASTGPSKGAVVISYDYDSLDSAGNPNFANVLNYGRYSNFAVNLQFETSSRIPNITSSINTATDPPSAIIVHQGGWIDAATPAAPGHMYIAGVNLGSTVTLGTFVLTLRVAWRFRR